MTNRVYLPDGNKIYVSDDQYGDARLLELYAKYGNLKMEWCNKVWGSALDDATAEWEGTIEEQYFDVPAEEASPIGQRFEGFKMVTA